MSEYLPIEIRHLDKTSVSLSSTDVFPIVVGNESDGFETLKASVSDVLEYIDFQNQELNLRTLNVRSSAYIENNLAIGNVAPDVNTKLYVDGDVVISGSLSSIGTSTFFDTQFVSTTSLSVKAAGGTSLIVEQEFEQAIAQFFDGNQISLHIDGSSERPGYVGVNTTLPNTHFTVLGNISAKDCVYSDKLNSYTAYISSVTSNNLNVTESAYIGAYKPTFTQIGNISGGELFLQGNVHINTDSLSSTGTIIGNDRSDVYINGDLFVKNISAYGDLFINTLPDQNKQFNLGNKNAVNNILGITLLSGFNYLNGQVYINSTGVGDTYLNSNENSGNLNIGNSLNQVSIKSNSLTFNNVITSEVLKLDFTDYDILTSTLDDIFTTSNVVFSSLTVGTDLTSVSSFIYKVEHSINGLNVNLSNQTIELGDIYTELNVNSNNFILNSSKTLSLNSKEGGSVNIGSKEVASSLYGYELNLNKNNDGVEKNTYINSEDGSGNVYIGNKDGDTRIFGSTLINTLSDQSADTIIGSLCTKVDIYNLNVYGRFGGNIKLIDVDTIEVLNFTSKYPQKMLGGFDSAQTCTISGDLKVANKLYLDGGIIEGSVSVTGPVSAPNLNIDGWQVVYTEFQISSAAWGTGGVAQQLSFDPATNVLGQSYGNTVSLSPIMYNTIDIITSMVMPITGANITNKNFTLTGNVTISGNLLQGDDNLAAGDYSHAEGKKTTASGNYSHTEGSYTRTGQNVVFDNYIYSTKTFTFSEATSGVFSYLNPGSKIRVYEDNNIRDIFSVDVVSRDENTGDIVVSRDLIGRNSNAGYIISNSGANSHAEGSNTIASGANSHAEGSNTIASGDNSHAAGVYAASNFDRSWVWHGSQDIIQFNNTKNDQFAVKAASGVYIAGNVGINTDNNSNALTVNGNISSSGDAYINGNVLIYGSLSALGQYTLIETQVGLTSAIEIINIGSGPALKVTQTGFNNIAEFYDDASPILILADNGKVGVGTTTPSTTLHLSGTDALVIPVGDTSQRVGVKGAIRYNNQDSTFEGYDGSYWGSLGGVKDIDQNTYISAETSPGDNNNQLKFITDGTEKAIIQPTGEMGIGTSTPNEILTVAGNISANGNLFVQSITAQDDILFNKNLTVVGNISSASDFYVQSLTAYNNSKFNKDLHVVNDLTVSNVFNLSAVTFTGEVYTNITSITAANEFIKVIANGQTKYIRLYDIE